MVTLEKIQTLIGDYEILFVTKSGSQILCSDCHDTDLVVVVKNWQYETKQIHADNTCLFCYSDSAFEKFAKMQLDNRLNIFAACLLFAQGDNVIYGENPLQNYNWWDYRDRAIESVLNYGKMSFFNPRLTAAKKRDCCIKQMIWGLAIYYILQNNSTTFTEEQQHIIQLCHDSELPLAYRDKLLQDFVALKQAEQKPTEVA